MTIVPFILTAKDLGRIFHTAHPEPIPRAFEMSHLRMSANLFEVLTDFLASEFNVVLTLGHDVEYLDEIFSGLQDRGVLIKAGVSTSSARHVLSKLAKKHNTKEQIESVPSLYGISVEHSGEAAWRAYLKIIEACERVRDSSDSVALFVAEGTDG